MKNFVFLCLATSFLLFACGESAPILSGCPEEGCGDGMYCDQVRGICVPNSTQNCTPPLSACGSVCVDFQSDVYNCGGCGQACGQNSLCTLGSCQCIGGRKDCNQQSYDGCECLECSTTNPTQCAEVQACSPNTTDSCGNTAAYCDVSTGTAQCVGCAAGFLNCDGVKGCECQSVCNGATCQTETSCNPTVENSCQSTGAFCNASTKECEACPQGFLNCDGLWTCECSGQCNGTQCQQTAPQCDPAKAFDCGANDTTQFCNSLTLQCEGCANSRNCDGTGGCEIPGSDCSQTKTCDPNDYNACGDQYWFCSSTTTQCEPCTTGTLNCDRVDNCEVAGSVCTTPPEQCSQTKPWDCGGTARYCAFDNTCDKCPPGQLNCDGLGGCLTVSSCTSTQSCTDGTDTGVCQDDSLSCSGHYESNLCPGLPTNVRCCLPASTAPQSCTNGYETGVCQEDNLSCAGTYVSYLCPGLPTNVRCCFSTSTPTCFNGTEKGKCQESSIYCSGHYEAGLCNGMSSTTLCCLPSAMGVCTYEPDGTSCTVDSKTGTCVNQSCCTGCYYLDGSTRKCKFESSDDYCGQDGQQCKDCAAGEACGGDPLSCSTDHVKYNMIAYQATLSSSYSPLPTEVELCVSYYGFTEKCSGEKAPDVSYKMSWNTVLFTYSIDSLTKYAHTFKITEDYWYGKDVLAECKKTISATDIQNGTMRITDCKDEFGNLNITEILIKFTKVN